MIEGSGDTVDQGYSPPIIMRPGRCYYMPPNGEPLTLTVGSTQRGPLKIAVAHENLHLAASTAPPSPMSGGSKSLAVDLEKSSEHAS